jgi:hypothetical protein
MAAVGPVVTLETAEAKRQTETVVAVLAAVATVLHTALVVVAELALLGRGLQAFTLAKLLAAVLAEKAHLQEKTPLLAQVTNIAPAVVMVGEAVDPVVVSQQITHFNAELTVVFELFGALVVHFRPQAQEICKWNTCYLTTL